MRAAVIAGGMTYALLGCASSHVTTDAGADVARDANALTDDERTVLAYVRAACEAYALCPTGLPHEEPLYAHGAAQCMREWGDPWARDLGDGLRRGVIQIDRDELDRCMTRFSAGRCPSSWLETNLGWASHCELSSVFVVGTLAAGRRCADQSCGVGLQCDGPDECQICLHTPMVGEACSFRGPLCRRPASCDGEVCAIHPTREVGEGEPCGLSSEEPGLEDLCAPGLFCDASDGDRPWVTRCRRVPTVGEPCPAGLCTAGSFCVPADAGDTCVRGPLRLGDACSGSADTDPCDHPNGLVCSDGRCVRAGHRLGEPCTVSSCDEGLVCSGSPQRCVPRTEPWLGFDREDGAPCEWSPDCRSGWCDRREPRVCRASDTACE